MLRSLLGSIAIAIGCAQPAAPSTGAPPPPAPTTPPFITKVFCVTTFEGRTAYAPEFCEQGLNDFYKAHPRARVEQMVPLQTAHDHVTFRGGTGYLLVVYRE
jgi:hypothetical protein